ncbi:MAG: hypothetical protein Q9172_005041 [Xanthocarpia lactea]
MTPPARTPAPRHLNVPERAAGLAQNHERLAEYRRNLEGYVSYRRHMGRLGGSAIKPASSPGASAANTTAFVSPTVPSPTPLQSSGSYGSVKGLDAEPAPPTTLRGASTSASTGSITSTTEEANFGCMEKGTKAPTKNTKGTAGGKKKGKQATDDDWVIVKDPRDLYVVVDRKTPRQRSA